MLDLCVPYDTSRMTSSRFTNPRFYSIHSLFILSVLQSVHCSIDIIFYKPATDFLLDKQTNILHVAWVTSPACFHRQHSIKPTMECNGYSAGFLVRPIGLLHCVGFFCSSVSLVPYSVQIVSPGCLLKGINLCCALNYVWMFVQLDWITCWWKQKQ